MVKSWSNFELNIRGKNGRKHFILFAKIKY
jgi:hypothetical protein